MNPQPLNSILPDLVPEILTPNSERWPHIVDQVKADLRKNGLDLDPSSLPEIIAKLFYGETKCGFLFCGCPGSGKSRRLRFICEVCRIKYIHINDLFLQLSNSFTEEECKRVINTLPTRWSETEPHCYSLAIDDVGLDTEPENIIRYGAVSAFMKNVIYDRYEFQSSAGQGVTLITTNLTAAQFAARYGLRVESRMFEMFAIVPLASGDRRKITSN